MPEEIDRIDRLATAKAVREPGSIEKAFSDQSDLITALIDRVELLRDRLSPIIQNLPSEALGKKETIAVCPMAERIEIHTDRLKTVYRHVDEIISRIEL